IVNAANSIIEKNKGRLEKVVWTANGEGSKILVNRTMTDGDEGRFVASSIFETKTARGSKNSDFAILYRTNAQSRAMEDALRKKGIPYRIYGGIGFYQRKEIKDVLSYLRLILNPKDEEALKRVINYPARGIGQTTIERLAVAADHYGKPMFFIMKYIEKAQLKINRGTQQKLEDFVTKIESFQILNKTYDAFQIAEHVTKKTGVLQELKKDGTPEGIARIENIEELLNGIRDFVEGQKEIAGATGNLSEFLEDVALATDLDNDTGDHDRVALMTVHLAKGLEFPHVYIVGMEENLFPSAMNMSTRSELEEERRLFYVALTRAEKQATLTYTQSRYRWGKLIDAEPSRFIEEMDSAFLEHLAPTAQNRYGPQIDNGIFGKVDPSKLRLRKPLLGQTQLEPTQEQLRKLRRLKPVNSAPGKAFNAAKANFREGTTVKHLRFGQGTILKIEGAGADTKAEIKFENGGIKKLLLRFAKLEALD
ncbi:MAG: ATP-dependent helicase, partial [Marinirhabdus sp.]